MVFQNNYSGIEELILNNKTLMTDFLTLNSNPSASDPSIKRLHYASQDNQLEFAALSLRSFDRLLRHFLNDSNLQNVLYNIENPNAPTSDIFDIVEKNIITFLEFLRGGICHERLAIAIHCNIARGSSFDSKSKKALANMDLGLSYSIRTLIRENGPYHKYYLSPEELSFYSLKLNNDRPAILSLSYLSPS